MHRDARVFVLDSEASDGVGCARTAGWASREAPLRRHGYGALQQIGRKGRSEQHPTGPVSRGEMADRKIVLRRHAERVGHTIEERKHRDHVDGFGDLVFRPTGVAQPLNVGGSRFVRGVCDERGVIEQGAFGRRQARFVKLTLQNRRNALIGGSLNTQEVGVAVESIRAPVEIGDVARDHLLVAAGEMALGEVNGIRELDDLAQEVGARSETFDDPRNLSATGG